MSRYDFHSTFGGYDDYSTFSLDKHNVDDLRKEYIKLRKEAKERIEELKKSEFADSKILENKEYLSVDPSDMNKEELVRMTAYTASFLASSQSTVEGQRERTSKAVETLNRMGYTNINTENFNEFGKYMDYLRVYIDSQILSSEKLLDFFDEAVEKGTDPDKLANLVNKTHASNITLTNLKRNVDFYIKNISNIERLDLNPNRSRKYTARELRKKLSAKDMLNE